MKRVLIFTLFLLINLCLWAQIPQKFSYQAVVRNHSNELVTNSPVNVTVIITQGLDGDVVYQETHVAQTNANGLFTLQIGDGTPIMGALATIEWGMGSFFLKTLIDLGGGIAPIETVQELLSVPYALYAATSGNGEGPQGPQGETGPQGPQGEPGPAGPQGEQGPAGPQGEQGPAGPQGEQGPAGPQGEQGPAGPQGEQGPAGPQGEQGPAGPQGEQGPVGPQGPQGEPGVGIPQMLSISGSVLTISEGNSVTLPAIGDAVPGPQGPQGEQGPAGPQGEQGPAGPQGEQGPAGPQGEQGPVGPQGEQGPVGPQGEQGPAGPQGEQGPAGPQGEQGPAGPQGEQGPAGPQGEQGPAGPQGPQGEPGVGIPQTLSLSGNTLYISEGNSVNLPSTVSAFSNDAGYLTRDSLEDCRCLTTEDIQALLDRIEALEEAVSNGNSGGDDNQGDDNGDDNGNENGGNGTAVDAQPCPGTPTVTDVDGNVYNTVQIGEQCWMRENLRTTKYANGTTIALGNSISNYISYRYYPNDDSTNVSTYGYLYNWYAVMNGASSSSTNPSNVQGICPRGWHVPSDAEWIDLTNYVSSQSQYVCGTTLNDIAKALASTEGWESSGYRCDVGDEPNANNTTGFSALPAGNYYSNYSGFAHTAIFWSTTQDDYRAYRYDLYKGDSKVSRGVEDKRSGFSVRCVKNTGSGNYAPDPTTDAQPCPGAPTVTDIDGNEYNTVKIGDQCWMRESLRTTKYANGTTIALGTTPSDLIPYRYYPNDSSDNVTTYGYLYNWYAVMNGASSSYANPSGVQGICPTGWHVPSDAEWTQLTDYVSSQSQYVCGTDITYIAKALASSEGWSTYNSDYCYVGNFPSANNATGFSALPAGAFGIYSNYTDFGSKAIFWSASDCQGRDMNKFNYSIYDFDSNYYKSCGYSVRCVKNVDNNDNSGNMGGGDNQGGTDGDDNQGGDDDNEDQGDDNGNDDNNGNDTTDTTITAQACPETPTITDVDGNVYNTVQIGEQCWMRENLRTTKYANGTTIALGSSTSSSTPCRYYPDNNSTNVFTYGYLYNWAAVMNGAASSSANPSSVQGICPTGWHVPSDAEWDELEDYVSSQSEYVCGGDEYYIAKALASTQGWNTSSENCAVGNNPDTNNATGFSALPAGHYDGLYDSFGHTAFFWSATQSSSYYAYYRELYYYNAYVNGSNVTLNKHDGFSVRCVKNSGGDDNQGGDNGDDNGNDDNNGNDTTDTTITAQACPETPTVTDVDGNVYNTVQIGEQCWMRENLRTTKYANGATIPSGLGYDWSESYPYYYCPDENTYNAERYGYLYNWPAVMNGASSSSTNPSNVQGVCPIGWHIPSNAEWNHLIDYVSNQSQYVCGDSTAYIAKALASAEYWNTSSNICAVGNNPNTNNATGFSALPIGNYISNFFDFGNYFAFGNSADFWSATRNGSTDNAYSCSLGNADANVYTHTPYMGYGYSVRCVKNVSDDNNQGGDNGDDDSNENGGNDSTTFARIVLEAGDVWGDGTGYQILIDEDCNTTVQYAQGNLTCGQSYADWEYTIPTYAAANDEAVCVNATMDILIPAGTYDYLVTNPGCNSYGVVYVAAEQCGQTRGQSVSFEANKTYYFVPSMDGQNDCVAITVFDGITGNGSGNDNDDTTPDAAVDAQPCPGMPTVTDVDGNVYNTVQIGEQCWMRENLRTTKSPNGVTIPYGTQAAHGTPYRCNSTGNVNPYGYLYNWAAVMNGAASSSANPSGVQGICPTGWHVPSDAEWTQLTNYVSSQIQYVCGTNTSNIAKALASTEGWNIGNDNCDVGNNPSTNNATGFSALPAGDSGGNQYGFGNRTAFWSATQSVNYHAYNCHIDHINPIVSSRSDYQGYLFSVRCVRN